MKNKLIIVIALVSLSIAVPTTKIQAQELEGHLSLSGAFALYPMAVKWAAEFKKIHPKVKIDVSAGGAGKGITDALAKMVDFGMVSRDLNPEELKKGAFSIAVTKDAVVPVINAANPNLKDLLAKGLKRDVALNIWVTKKYQSWSQAFGFKSNLPIHAYTRSDASGAAEIWAKYFSKKQDDLQGVGVFGDPGLAAAVRKDVAGIGFNNIGYVYDAKTKKQNPGIRVLPIDINNNGKIDADENFYDSMDQLVEAISNGKYPSPPARDLLLVSKGKPSSKLQIEFLKWVLTNGQKYVHESGFISLAKDKLDKELAKIK